LEWVEGSIAELELALNLILEKLSASTALSLLFEAIAVYSTGRQAAGGDADEGRGRGG